MQDELPPPSPGYLFIFVCFISSAQLLWLFAKDAVLTLPLTQILLRFCLNFQIQVMCSFKEMRYLG